MTYPTDGFTSQPVSVGVSITDGAYSQISVTADVTAIADGEGALSISDSQTQDLFAVIGNAISSYLSTTYPGTTISNASVSYSGSKSVSF